MCCALGFVFVFWALGIDGMDLFFDVWDFYTWVDTRSDLLTA